MCAVVLAPSLVAIIALGVAAMSGGRNTNWMKYQQMEPPYTFESGYDGYMVYNQFGLTDSAKLRRIWMPLWILGIVSVGLLGLSVLLAVLLFLVTMSGFASHWLTILTIPMGLTQLAATIGYVVVAIWQIRNYTAQTVNQGFYTPVPDWGWVCAFIVGVLWLWCTAWLGVMPRRKKHHDDDDYEPATFQGQPQQQPRSWFGGKAQAHAPASPEVKVQVPDEVQLVATEPKKKGLLGFGFGGKGKEPEVVQEEYRARPFTETPAVGTDGVSKQQDPRVMAAPEQVEGPTRLPDPPFQPSTGAWAPPSGQQPSWVGAPDPELKPKSRGLLGAFKK
eukprot:jgi/Botrbrau1/18136/Bobra.53_1s0012.2